MIARTISCTRVRSVFAELGHRISEDRKNISDVAIELGAYALPGGSLGCSLEINTRFTLFGRGIHRRKLGSKVILTVS